MRDMKCVFSALVLFFALTGCTNLPASKKNTTSDLHTIQKLVSPFHQRHELSDFFAKAKGFAVLDSTFRAGAGFGGAYGAGWLIENEKITHKISHWQFLAGVDFGMQMYQQIVFFRTEEALATFRASTLEFAGQLNATALVWGDGRTAGYNPDVAVFTLVDGGLMLEASVGAHYYNLSPL